MDCYATHMPMVSAMAAKTQGPILEMGCGHYSSYILHEVCKVMGRTLVTLDEKPDWIEEFKFLKSPFHELYLVDDQALCSLIDNVRWSMVLIDHAPGERRKFDIERLKDKADFLIIQDTEEAGYEYEKVLPQFKYRFDYKIVRPWTTVVSNFHDLEPYCQFQ